MRVAKREIFVLSAAITERNPPRSPLSQSRIEHSRLDMNSSDKSTDQIPLQVEPEVLQTTKAVNSLDEEVERTMWTRQYAARDITMNPTPHSRLKNNQRPILSGNMRNMINPPKVITEDKKMSTQTNKTPNRVVLVKGEDQWRFEWESGQELKTIEAITEIAKSPETNFDWFDAAMVCHEMSKITSKAA